VSTRRPFPDVSDNRVQIPATTSQILVLAFDYVFGVYLADQDRAGLIVSMQDMIQNSTSNIHFLPITRLST
jgi:hypothetical protein